MSSPTPTPDDRSIDELIAEFKSLYAQAEETRQKMEELSARIAQRTGGLQATAAPMQPLAPGNAAQPQQ